MKTRRMAAAVGIWMLLLAGASSVPSRSSAQNPTGYKIPDRVEVNRDGTWYKGTIYAERDGKFLVMRDGFMSDEHWVTPGELRHVAEAVVAQPKSKNLPATIPTGHYHCATTMGSMLTTIGTMRVLGATSYTAVTKEGTGARAEFSYDPATGAVQFPGGKLQGFFGLVESSRVFVNDRGVPGIDVVYRVRPGGNRFNLDCERDGS